MAILTELKDVDHSGLSFNGTNDDRKVDTMSYITPSKGTKGIVKGLCCTILHK